ncbi:MAG: SDR family NAD(P)-dependent oxidoreductase, partial [Bacteroidota bacterium]
MKKFILAYCADNRSAANKIDADLQAAGIQFEHLPIQEADSQGDLGQRLQKTSKPVLLLISDNFLKSAACMNNIMLHLQNLERSNRVMVVIVDGYYFSNAAGAQHIPTTFERVSNVIQYMNYWQEQYLDMRKRRRSISAEQEGVFNARLRVIRGISTEIGEFLRYLRGIDYLKHQQFTHDRYRVFFERTGQQQLYTSFALTQMEEEPEEKPAQENNAPSPNVPSENSNLANPASDSSPSPTFPGEQTDSHNEEGEEEGKEDPTPGQVESPTPPTVTPQVFSEEIPTTDEVLDVENPQQSDQVVESNAGIPSSIIDAIMEEEERDMEASVEEEEELSEKESYDLLQSIYEEEEEETIAEEQSPTAEVAPPSHEEAIDTEPEEDLPMSDIEDWEDQLEEAEELFEDGHAEQGLERMQELIHQYPDHIEIRYAYAQVLHTYLNKPDAAIAQLETLGERYPTEVRAQILIGEIAESQGNYELAIAHYEEALNRNPDIPGVDFQLGMLIAEYQEGKEKLAARYLKRALKKDKDDPETNYQYAVLLNEQLDKTPKAIKLFERCLELNPEHPFANYDLALIYYNEGQLDLASEYYEQAYLINPELKTPANDLAFGMKQQEKVAKLEQSVSQTLAKAAGGMEPQEVVTTPVVEVAVEEEVDEMIEELEELDVHVEVAEEVEEEEPEPVEEAALVLITGATSGIGRATAQLFAKEGYRLLLTGRRQDRLEAMQQSFEELYGSRPEILAFDVRDANAAQKAIDDLPAALKDIDILINNAGLAKGFAPIHEGELRHWEQMIDTNIKGLLYMSRLISPFMVERKRGFIINV